MKVAKVVGVVIALFAAAFVALAIVLDPVVTYEYPTLADARADNLFAKGWLPEVLPASTHSIRTDNNVEMSTSEGVFSFAPADFALLKGHLAPLHSVPARFRYREDTIKKKIEKGFEPFTYQEDKTIWVFLCRPEGTCEYHMIYEYGA